MKRTFALVTTGLIALASATAALAEPLAFTIDKNHSSVGFKIRHFFAKVDGRFNDFAGTVSYDAKDLSKSSVEVTIQAASIFTNNDRRDNDLRSENFFDVAKFPTATFKSTKVVPGEGRAFTIEGDLTMHGMTKSVTLNATLLGIGDVPGRENEVRTIAGFEAKTTINRKDFGIVWNRALDNGAFMLGDDVEITLQVEAGRDKSADVKAEAVTK